LYRAKISIDDRRLLIAFNGYKTGLLCQKKTTTGGCADRCLILCDVTIDQRALLKCKDLAPLQQQQQKNDILGHIQLRSHH
jgi:hypothetical protein